MKKGPGKPAHGSQHPKKVAAASKGMPKAAPSAKAKAPVTKKQTKPLYGEAAAQARYKKTGRD